jgi:hypothetical protein
MDLKANKECDKKGVKTLERKVYPSMVYPCKGKFANQSKEKRKIHSPTVGRHRINIGNKVS